MHNLTHVSVVELKGISQDGVNDFIVFNHANQVSTLNV